MYMRNVSWVTSKESERGDQERKNHTFITLFSVTGEIAEGVCKLSINNILKGSSPGICALFSIGHSAMEAIPLD